MCQHFGIFCATKGGLCFVPVQQKCVLLHVLQATLPIRHGSQNLTCMRLSGALRMAKISSSAPTMRNLEHAC